MNPSKSSLVYFYSGVSRARNNTGISWFWCLQILYLLSWQNVLNFVILLCCPSGYFFSLRRTRELIEHCSCSSVVVFRCLLCAALFKKAIVCPHVCSSAEFLRWPYCAESPSFSIFISSLSVLSYHYEIKIILKRGFPFPRNCLGIGSSWVT